VVGGLKIILKFLGVFKIVAKYFNAFQGQSKKSCFQFKVVKMIPFKEGGKKGRKREDEARMHPICFLWNLNPCTEASVGHCQNVSAKKRLP